MRFVRHQKYVKLSTIHSKNINNEERIEKRFFKCLIYDVLIIFRIKLSFKDDSNKKMNTNLTKQDYW